MIGVIASGASLERTATKALADSSFEVRLRRAPRMTARNAAYRSRKSRKNERFSPGGATGLP